MMKRYVLDRKGRLHGLSRRHKVDAVAIVRVTPINERLAKKAIKGELHLATDPAPVAELSPAAGANLGTGEADRKPPRPPAFGDRSPPDLSRQVEALRARKVAPPAPPPARTLPPAMSREACPRCGIPGFKGCEHQAPYPEVPVPKGKG